MPLVAGADCSTQSTKVLVVDVDDGSVVASGGAAHEVEGDGGARESDPRDWEGSLAHALTMTGRTAEVEAISIGAQQHGLVVLDGAGRPLRKAPLWNDTRGAADARALVAALGGPEAAARRTGSVPTSSFTVAHWAWLRRAEPEVAAAARHVLLPHDYLSFCLTGALTTDRSDVSGTGWWSPADESYAADVLGLDAVQLDPGYLPEVLAPTAAAGTVTTGAAERFGLRPGARSLAAPATMPPALWPSALRRGRRPYPWGRPGLFTPPPPDRARTVPARSPVLPVPMAVTSPWPAR